MKKLLKILVTLVVGGWLYYLAGLEAVFHAMGGDNQIVLLAAIFYIVLILCVSFWSGTL